MRSGIVTGDCLEALPAIPDGAIDAIVTDPPYGLGFMGKAWDGLPPGELWASECLRVLRPGGHLLAFGGTRTYHRLVVAIEDGGFEIRDCLCWLYGSGFPKSHDVSKAIDKAAGATREIVGHRKPEGSAIAGDTAPDSSGSHIWTGRLTSDTPATPDAERWNGWGTALKPAFEPIVLARKPLIGTVAANVLAHGTGALNVDGCRIEHDGSGTWGDTQNPDRHTSALGYQGGEVGEVSSRNPLGRWPANVLLDPEAAALLDAQTGALHSQNPATRRSRSTAVGVTAMGTGASVEYADTGGASRFFYCAKASSRERNAGLDGFEVMRVRQSGHVDERVWDIPGSHSQRRPNYHPTVKPVELMRWLVRLVTPPGGLVLDPFAGSGTTGIACGLEALSFIGVEQDADYAAIARARIEWWASNG